MNLSSTRLTAFSDAVFGLAATLLVIHVDIPATMENVLLQLSQVVVFAINFAVVFTLWTVHRALSNRVSLHDPWITVLNGVFLFVVLFYIFPLKFLSASIVSLFLPNTAFISPDQLRNAFVMYSVGFISVFGAVSALYFREYRLQERNRLGMHWMYFRHYALFVVVGVLSVTVAALEWGLFFGLPGMLYGLLGPLCYWNGRRFVRRRTYDVAPSTNELSEPSTVKKVIE